VKRADTARFARFHAAMLERGVHLPPSQFEAWFLSTAHADADLDEVIAAARESLRAVATVGT
jgi:glutamate-1-semialdehyde 2,1-aminomutase